MKNIIKIFTTTVLVSVLAAGCNKFLDTGKSNETQTVFPSSQADLLELLDATYDILVENLDDPASSDWMTMSICSDDCYGGGGANDYDVQAANQLLYNDINVHENFWTLYYQGVARANLLINSIDKVSWTGMEKKRNQTLGEAYFLRGYFLYQLTTMFGDIPLSTDAEYMDTVKVISSGYADTVVFPHIISDFISGRNLMNNEKKPGHANKYVAEGMIARAYMFWAGFYKKVEELVNGSCPAIPLFEQEGYTAQSLSKDSVVAGLKDVIDNSGYKLLEDYRSLWSYSNHSVYDITQTSKERGYGYLYEFIADMKRDNCWDMPGMGGDENDCPEILFSIHFSHLTGTPNKLVKYMSMRDRDWNDVWPFSPGGYGWAPASCNLNDDWKAAEAGGSWSTSYSDIRRIGSIITDKSPDPENYTPGKEGQMEETCMWSKKFCTVGTVTTKDDGSEEHFFEFSSLSDFGGPGTDLDLGHSIQDIYILRYADILLMTTELVGDAQYMNQVQGRAGVPQTGYSLKAVQDERRWEFAFESLRWNDIRRWSGGAKHSEISYAAKALQAQQGKQIYNYFGAPKTKMTLKHKTCTWKKRYADTHGFRPIPQSVIALWGGRLAQNPGWDTEEAIFTGYTHSDFY